MPNCVVKGCKNHSSKSKKQDGITFHTLPIRNNDIKLKWIEVIRVSRNEPSWNPTVRSVVCSTHFEDDDFYNTKNGLRRVVRNGYPKHLSAAPNQPPNMDLNEPSTIYAHVSDTPIDSMDVDPLQPSSSRVHIPATPSELIDVDTIQPYSVQTHISVTPVLSSTPIQNTKIESESIFDTPMKHKLRQRIFRLENKQKLMKLKIKNLNQKVRRLKERNKSLKEILQNYKSRTI